MKFTGFTLSRDISVANASSKHMGVGLHQEHIPTGYTISLVRRSDGLTLSSQRDLSIREAQAAVRMFYEVAKNVAQETKV